MDRSPKSRYAERVNRFFAGAVLALGAATVSLPLILILLHPGRVPLRQSVIVKALIVIAGFAVMGVAKLIQCISSGALDYITAVSFGVLLVFVVLLVYAGVFVFVATNSLSFDSCFAAASIFAEI